jgi:polyhydroxybutyrate depolymerase
VADAGLPPVTEVAAEVGQDVVAEPPPETLGPADRPARLVVPDAHDGVTPLPLAFLLHGYTASGLIQDTYFGASSAAKAMGVYLVVPDGTVGLDGNRFWNATPACCDFYGSGIDDVGYLTALLDEAQALLPVDATRVYFIGHSNGGFMSYRLACTLAGRITAIASLAGGDYPSDTDCVPSQPVSVLQMHGDLDSVIPYGGDPGGYPSARTTVVRWAKRAGCDVANVSAGEPMDLDMWLPGSETQVERWSTGCLAGYDAELWTIGGGSHTPGLSTDFMPAVLSWLLGHSG